MARVGTIISTNNYDGHITGNTKRITTDIVAGWCGVDCVERVSFDYYSKTRTLDIDVEGRLYRLMGIRKDEYLDELIAFLRMEYREMQQYRIK